MDAVVLASLAGAAFGALTVAVRWGLGRGVDPEVGALAAVLVGSAASGAVAALFALTRGADTGELWPFFVAGMAAPGASQILLTHAVRLADPSRTAILMGTAPLMSVLIAFMLLGERFRLVLLIGTVLIVVVGGVLAADGKRPAHFRASGGLLALLCAALFAARDNTHRWGVRGEHPPPPLVAATSSLLAASAFILVYLVLMRRESLRTDLPHAMRAFAPAGLLLALGYGALLAAFDRGRVVLVSPLNATGSLWAVLLSAVLLGRSDIIGRRTVIAALLVVAGGAVIGAFR